MSNKEKVINLKVQEAYQEDINKGIVRIDAQMLKSIGARPGDYVEIVGQRKTIAIAERAYNADLGKNIVRMDGITRGNAHTSLGNFINIKLLSDVKSAKRIVVAPAKKGLIVQASPELFSRSLLGRPLSQGDIISVSATMKQSPRSSASPFHEIFDILDEVNFGLGELRFVVVSTNPKKDYVVITKDTEIEVKSAYVEVEDAASVPDVTYEDIGGMDDEVQKIREMVELPLRHPELFERLGIEPPKGVLLHGPPGTGKTLLAKAVANETNAHFITINGPEIMSKFYGESEANIRKIFEDAEKNAPSIIFIDEIDSLAPKREESKGEVERRVVAQLLTLLDGLKSRGKVIVIAATNIPNAIDPALRRPGRFDREIEIMPPGKKGRFEILKIHTRNMPLSKDVKLSDIADITHGFVGADLAALSKETAMVVLRRILPDLKSSKNDEQKELPKKLLEKLKITQKDFREALKVVQPSAMREFYVEIPNTKWDDIGGLDDIKQKLLEAVEMPIKEPECFENLGIKPPRGVLLYGPPGTGKTLLAKAVANESEANFILVKGPELLTKWVGESEKAVRKVFEKARQTSPTIIFFDEIDAIAAVRGAGIDTKVTERVVNQMLTEMDGLEELNDVIVIAATNRPDIVDPALLRPGRFDRIILVYPPDEPTRLSIFKVHTKSMPLANDVDLNEFSRKTEYFVGADIEALCREAAMCALRKDKSANQVTRDDFEKALTQVRPSTTKAIQEAYEQVKSKFSSAQSKKFADDAARYFG